MDKPDLSAIAAKMVSAVRAVVARAEASMGQRLDELDGRLKAIPPVQNGKDGEHGDKGEQGRNAFDVAVSLGFDGDVYAWQESLRGPPGKDGESITADHLQKSVAAEVAKVVAQFPPAPKGEPGKDGQSVHPDTVALMVRDAVQKAISALPPAKDGERGRDAVEIMVLPGIDESRSYSAGTYARYNGGEVRAERRTDPVKDGDLAAAGWTVIRDGVAAIVVTQGDDPRVIEVVAMLTSGTKTVAEFTVPALIDCGVYRAGQKYAKGDCVSYGGSIWSAQRGTDAKPETDDSWRLSVKRGRDGKDGERGPKGENGPSGKNGKDLTQLGTDGAKW